MERRKFIFRIVLVLSQMFLIAVLASMGNQQRKARLNGDMAAWDYIPPAEVVLHSINYPAAIAAGVTTARGNFEFGIEYSRVRFAVYCLYAVLLWYGVGLCFDKGYFRKAAVLKTPIVVLGVLWSLILVVTAFLLIGGPYALVLLLSSFAWSAVFLGFFLRAAHRNLFHGQGVPRPA